MAFSVTIAGVDRTALVDAAVTVERRVSGLGTIVFRVVDVSGAWQPEQFDAVAVAMTGQPTRTGVIAVPPEVGYLQRVQGAAGAVSFGIDAQVTAHDASAIAGYVMRNGIDAGPITLKAMLQRLVDDNLAVWGVTLAAGQATGPTFETLTWPWQTAAQVLDFLTAAAAAATGKSWIWRIDDAHVLEVWEVGAKTAPQTLTTDDLLEIIPSTDAPPFRNDQYLVYGPSELRDVVDVHAGDGSRRQFVLRYHVASPPGIVTVQPAGVTYPVGTYGVDALQWTYDAATLSIRQDAAYTALTSAQRLEVPHASQFPNVVHVGDAASIAAVGVYARQDTDQTVVDWTSAIARATALLQASTARARRLSVRTLVSGCDPGEVVIVSAPAVPGVPGAYLIERSATTYRARSGEDPLVEHVLDLVEGDLRTETSEDWMRGVLAGGGGGGSLAGVGGVSTAVIAPGFEGDLGGSRLAGVSHTTWAPVREHREWVCPADGTYTAHVEAWTAAGATSCTPRVYDITGAAAAATGSSTTSTSPVKQQLVFSAVAGRSYRLELLPGNTTNEVYGLGKVRS